MNFNIREGWIELLNQLIPSEEDFKYFASKISKYLRDKPLYRKIPKGPVLYVGDIHGFYNNILYALYVAKEKEANSIVFLGDYADRGPEQIRCLTSILYLFASSEGLKGTFDFIEEELLEIQPFKIIALRGNHEDTFLNKRYGLKAEFAKYYGYGFFPEEDLMKLYSHLPLVAVSKSGSIGIHGGIPFFQCQVNSIEFKKELKQARTPFFINMSGNVQSEFDLALRQLLWNDPDEWIISNKPLFIDNFRGEGFFKFNECALDEFLDAWGLKRLIRSHQSSRGAFNLLWNNKLVDIFSAFPYFGSIDSPAFYLEYENGDGEVVNHKGDILKKIKNTDESELSISII